MLKGIKDNIIRKVASKHVAGPGIHDAMRICRWADDNGYAIILSPWKITGENALKMLARYKENIIALHDNNLSGYTSIKLDAIDYDFGLFKDILSLGKEYNIRIHLDSLDPSSAETTFRLIEKANGFHDILGCTLPSRWQRSLDDAARAADLGLAVRIVKGQWEDVNIHKPDCRENYLAIADKLAGTAHRVGIATHDLPLARRALLMLKAADTYCEFEQFFSLPLNGMKTAKEYGIPYRVYIAYGEPGIPYNVKFALNRPGILTWMLADYAFDLKKPWVGQ